jgi:O-antigen/teichoic acid export membrane protein
MILASLADLGLNVLLTRSVARDRTGGGDLFLRIVYVKTATFTAVAAAVAIWPGLSGWRVLALLFVGIAVSSNLLDQIGAFCLAHERVEVEARLKFVLTAVILGLGLVGSLTAPRVETAAALLLAAQIASVAVGLRLVSTQVVPLPMPTAWPRPAWPASDRTEVAALALVGVGLSSFSRMDVIALKFFHIPDVQIGLYFAAERLIVILTLIPGILAVAALPVLSDHHAKDPEANRRAQKRLLGLLLGAGSVAAAVLALASGPLVVLLYGRDYAESAGILRWLCLALPFMFVNHMSVNTLIAGERSRRAAVAAAAAFVANALADVLLVPRLGVRGAALASVAGQGTLSALACLRLLLEAPAGAGGPGAPGKPMSPRAAEAAEVGR